MPRVVWLNGRVVDAVDARVSAFDAGVQHGVGLFETMLAEATGASPSGRVFRLAEHLARLESSSRALGLMTSLNTRALAEAVEGVVSESGLCAGGGGRARVRLTVTGGDLNMLTAARSGGGGAGSDPTVLIDAQPAQSYPAAMFENGVRLLVASAKANPLNEHEGHKTLNYWWRLRALQEAASKGCGEALVLQVTNHLCGGAVSNVFVVKGGVLMTPIARGEEKEGGVPSPVLPGVTRGLMLELARERGVRVETRMLSVEDALDAEEVFLTNSGWGVLPVSGIEQGAIGGGGVGELTRELRVAWEGAVGSEV